MDRNQNWCVERLGSENGKLAGRSSVLSARASAWTSKILVLALKMRVTIEMF